MSTIIQAFIYSKATGNIVRNFEGPTLPEPPFFSDDDLAIHEGQIVENYHSFRVDLDDLAQGIVTLIEREDLVLPIEYLRKRARKILRRIVDQKRCKHLTPGGAQIQDYQEKLREAEAYDTDPAPDPANYPMLAAEVGFHGTTSIADMATIVQARAAATREALAAINTVKFTAIAAIESADTETELDAVLDNLTWPAP